MYKYPHYLLHYSQVQLFVYHMYLLIQGENSSF